ncbi:YceI family protein [Woodsholea maritima]|uniref:YceI family protein n=1 Tax=Woodsholea maritima TaxID=240237 RepID=UPI0003777454|nr:YceI family protein [Woodsholea maritima]
MASHSTLLTALAWACLLAPASFAQDWIVDKDASLLRLTTHVSSEEVIGRFSEFDAAITLNPDDLSTAHIDAVVQTGSGHIAKSDYQSAMVGGAGLDITAHPEARFVSERVVKTETGYEAQGILTIKDHSQPAILPFTLEIEGDRAIANGELVIQRAEFGVGAAGWGSAAATITLNIHIEADRAQ